MGKVSDAILDAPALGDILMGRHPSAIGQRFVHDLDDTSVRCVDDHRFPQPDVAPDALAIFVDVVHERSGGFPMSNDLAEAAALLHYFSRQTVHIAIALVADDKPLR